MALHKTHQAVLDCIRLHIHDYQTSPTVQEIEDEVGRPRGSVQNSLNRLKEHGLIDWKKYKSRTIRLLEKIIEEEATRPAQKGLPVLGDIAAGYFHEPYIEAEDFIDMSYPGQQPDDYVLRVSGDSMIDAGIRSGALVGIRPVLKDYQPRQGEIVALRVSGRGATLKHYYQEDSIVVLKAANSEYEPTILDLKTTEVTVHGIHIFTHWQSAKLGNALAT